MDVYFNRLWKWWRCSYITYCQCCWALCSWSSDQKLFIYRKRWIG